MKEDSYTPQPVAGFEMPHSVDAEQSVLGAILIDSEVLAVVLDRQIKPEFFYTEQHRELFSIMIRKFSDGSKSDAVIVLNEAMAGRVFETVAEGRSYIGSLMERVPSVSNVGDYCTIIIDKYYARCLATIAQSIMSEVASGNYESSLLLDAAEQRIFDIRQGRDVKGLTPLNDVVYGAYDQLAKRTGPDKDKYLGAKTGFTDLDAVTTGLNRSDLILLAARPGMGKTSFAMNLALSVARKQNKTVAVFSLEMSKEQLATRLLSTEALVESSKLRTGKLDPDDWKRLASSADTLCHLPMHIDDTAAITVQQMKAKVRRLSNLGLIVIDYLQLMSSTLKTDNRVTIISEITRQLKIMAKELDVPIILLSQLSRGPEARTDKRPMLSDLRESGSIEQDADIVMFLYRDAYYNKECPTPNISECIIAKNRHGTTATIELVWDGQFTRFANKDVANA